MAAGSQAQGLGGAQRSLPLSPLLLGREPESCVPTERRAVLPLPSPQPWRTADHPVPPTPPPARLHLDSGRGGHKARAHPGPVGPPLTRTAAALRDSMDCKYCIIRRRK